MLQCGSDDLIDGDEMELAKPGRIIRSDFRQECAPCEYDLQGTFSQNGFKWPEIEIAGRKLS